MNAKLDHEKNVRSGGTNSFEGKDSENLPSDVLTYTYTREQY